MHSVNPVSTQSTQKSLLGVDKQGAALPVEWELHFDDHSLCAFIAGEMRSAKMGCGCRLRDSQNLSSHDGGSGAERSSALFT